jgi:hypothetical protein
LQQAIEPVGLQHGGGRMIGTSPMRCSSEQKHVGVSATGRSSPTLIRATTKITNIVIE